VSKAPSGEVTVAGDYRPVPAGPALNGLDPDPLQKEDSELLASRYSALELVPWQCG